MGGIAMKQVLDIEQMHHLQELGLGQNNDTMLSWIVDEREKDKPLLCASLDAIDYVDFSHYCIPAYTLQDVLDLLPKQIGVEYIYDLCIFPESISYTQFIGGEINDNLFEVPINESLIDAAYSLLCWAIENGYVKTNKEEQK